MKQVDTVDESKGSFWKKVKIWLCISASLLVVILTTLIIIIISRFKDFNRCTYTPRGIEASEIVKKNYIDGFENSKNTGKFQYILPKDDINELLSIGTKAIDHINIENIYYDESSEGYRYFFVDLKKVGVKTRVVFTTVPTLKNSETISLKIASVSIGKVNALRLLSRKGYISSEFINNYFSKCHIPMSFDESNLSFDIHPYDWVNMFPESTFGKEMFETSKSVEGAYSLSANLFGFNLDISKLSKGYEYIEVDESVTPNIYEEVKQGCLDNFDILSDGETRTIYSLDEEGFNKLVKSSFILDMKEEITSEYTSNKTIFDFIGCNMVIEQEDKVKMRLFYSINGYTVSSESYLTYLIPSSGSTTFKARFEKPILSGVDDTATSGVLSGLATYDYFDYTTSNNMFTLNLESLNQEFNSNPDLRDCQKSIVINPSARTIDFKITK